MPEGSRLPELGQSRYAAQQTWWKLTQTYQLRWRGRDVTQGTRIQWKLGVKHTCFVIGRISFRESFQGRTEAAAVNKRECPSIIPVGRNTCLLLTHIYPQSHNSYKHPCTPPAKLVSISYHGYIIWNTAVRLTQTSESHGVDRFHNHRLVRSLSVTGPKGIFPLAPHKDNHKHTRTHKTIEYGPYASEKVRQQRLTLL